MMKDDFLGATEVDLRAMALNEWVRFKQRLRDGAGAELEFDAYFKPTPYHQLVIEHTSMLYLRVNSASNLNNKDTGILGDVSDPYVKVVLGNREQRTPTLQNQLNPEWQEGNQFTFTLNNDDT